MSAATERLQDLATRLHPSKAPNAGGPPAELRCTECGRRPQARSLKQRPDGTLEHKPCGALVDVAEPAPPAPPRRKPAKQVKTATTQRRAAKPREATPTGKDPLAAVRAVLDAWEQCDETDRAYLRARLGVRN